MTKWQDRLVANEQAAEAFRLTEFPMHYFAAIQKRNQVNLGRKLDRLELTPLDWRILASLREYGSMTINDLADITVFDRFKVSRGANALIERGLVEESPVSRDGRRRRLALSERGHQAYRQAFEVVAQMYRANFDGLSDEEFDQLMTLLLRIKDNVYRIEGYLG